MEPLVRERLRRAQLAGRESRIRTAEGLEMRIDGGERIAERQRLREARPLELVARLRRDAAGKLKHRLDVAVAACFEYRDLGHGAVLSCRSQASRFPCLSTTL